MITSNSGTDFIALAKASGTNPWRLFKNQNSKNGLLSI
jgi:hypothetical protein